MEKLGFQLRWPIDPSAFYGKYDHHFSNGSPADRAAALMELLRDDSVSIILTARGGYGSMEILPFLDFDVVASANKTIVGMSDACALLLPWTGKARVCSIHGPGLGTAFADYRESEDARKSADSLISTLCDPSYRYSGSGRIIRPGSGRGEIAVSNLSMLTSLLGTPWQPDLAGVVLVLEEVGSRPFQVHRCLLQLTLSGLLSNLSALVFGRFSRCDATHGPSVDEVISSLPTGMLSETHYPIVCGLPFGHWGENQALPLGREALVEDELFAVAEAAIA
jgi:muramoyltetrapeptide carboxypeptidase